MSYHRKAEAYENLLNQIAVMKIEVVKIGMMPVSIAMQMEILEALILKEIRDLEIG